MNRVIPALALWSVVLLVSGCSSESRSTDAGNMQESAIAAAKEVFNQKKAEGVDFSKGPCIAQEVIPGWAVDVAHDPRQPVDDNPVNQCASYREGRASHFVELDLEGRLIRAR